MKPKTALVLTVLVLGLSSSTSRDEAPAFGVSAGAALEKSFRTKGQVVLEDAELLMNGENADLEQMGIPADLEVALGYELDCTDTYESVAEVRPLVLVRAFQTMRFHTEANGESEEDDKLGGKTVRFEWDAANEVYKKSFVGDEGGDAEDLDALREDLDLRSLLPEGEVSVGDTWTVDGIGMVELWLPGLDVRGQLEGGDLGEAPPELIENLKAFGEKLSIQCTYQGEVEEGGVRLAQIALAADVDESIPIDPSLIANDPEAPPFDWDHLDVKLELDYEGTLLWNQAEGRFASFESKSQGAANLDFQFEIPDFDLAIEGQLEFSLSFETQGKAG